MSVVKARATGVAEAKSLIQETSKAAYGAIQCLQDATDIHHASRLSLIDAERAVKDARNGILAKHAEDPKALGSNEAARDASVAALCSKETAALDSARRAAIATEGDVNRAKLDLDGYKIGVDHAKALVSLAELRTQVSVTNAMVAATSGRAA
jgi:hypothetical protein